MDIDSFVGRYWHKLTQEEKTWIMKHSGKNWQWLIDNVKQPNWCNYPEALSGYCGCWSLILPGQDGKWKDISPKYCRRCELSKWGERRTALMEIAIKPVLMIQKIFRHLTTLF